MHFFHFNQLCSRFRLGTAQGRNLDFFCQQNLRIGISNKKPGTVIPATRFSIYLLQQTVG